MPELPEVETVARSLRPFLVGRCVTSFTRVWPKVLENARLPDFVVAVQNRRILEVRRRAKYLALVLDAGYVLVHLRMTGRLYPVSGAWAAGRHVSATFGLDDGQTLVFEDQRRFGRIYYYKDTSALRAFSERFGPEPLGPDFTAHWLVHNLRTHQRQIKPLLLDQEFLAGLGNIYVDEALWLARIHPLTAACRVPPARVRRLHGAIREVLEKSLAANGTTFMNFKFLGGYEGGYTDQLLVFDREGAPCKRCGRPIRKLRVAQRGTHICEHCQRFVP